MYSDYIKLYEENGKWIVEEGKRKASRGKGWNKDMCYPRKRTEFDTKELARVFMDDLESNSYGF